MYLKKGSKMKKLFILLGVILLSIFCVGCDKNEEVVNELSKEELNYLKQIYYNDEESQDWPEVDRLKDQVDSAKNHEGDFYIIDYINQEKYICGYVPEKIKKIITNQEIHFSDNVFVQIRYSLQLENIQFDFCDIKWKSYEKNEKILYSIENNYKLTFVIKENSVNVSEDINNNKINIPIKHFIIVNFQKDGKYVTVYESILNNSHAFSRQLENGKYLIYLTNDRISDGMTFNELVKDMLFYRNKENYCIKIKEENNKLFLLEKSDIVEHKYRDLKEYFNITNIQNQDEIVFDYEEYKNAIIELINKWEKE